MAYIIHYDICALFILILCIGSFFFRKNIPVLQTKVFFLLLCITFLSTLGEIFSVLTCLYPSAFPYAVIHAVNILFFTATNLIPAVYAFYCYTFLHPDYTLKTDKRILLIFVPYAAEVILIATSFVTNFVYIIKSDHSYARMPGISFLYICALLYILLGTIILLRAYSILTKKKRIISFSFFLFSLIGVCIQLFFPALIVQNFAVSFSLLLILLSLHKPDIVIDSSTDQFNQNAFLIMADRAFHTRKPFTVITVLIEDIPFLNNTFGIPCISSILKDIALFLSDFTEKKAVYHISQQTFCLLFAGKSEKEIAACANAIKERFDKTWRRQLLEVTVSVRICIISCPNDASTVESIFDINSIAEFHDSYKQEKILYARTLDTISYKRHSYVEQAIKTALAADRVCVYYQPLFSVKEQRVVGAEALVRLTDKRGIFIPPDEFIPIAERNGSILRIGQFVLENVCRFYATNKLEALGLKMVDINLSVVQGMQHNLAEQIISTIESYKISPKLINLEITETAATHTPKALLLNMKKLINYGFSFSLDDFGSGYANINYIMHLPFSVIKLDKDIVWSKFSDEKASVILSSIINMIKQTGQKIIAEGIETAEQASALTDLGCDYLQGFYYSQPLSEEQFLTLLKKSAL